MHLILPPSWYITLKSPDKLLIQVTLLLNNTNLFCYLNFLVFYLQIGASKMLEMHFSQSQNPNFQNFLGELPPDPLQGDQKYFLAPARLEKFLDQ